MLDAAQFGIQQVKFHYFTADVGFSQATILAVLLRDFRPTFDGQITTLPLPSEAPAEIPRVLLASADSSLSIEAGPERLTFVLNSHVAAAPTPAEALELSIRCMESYRGAASFRIGRLAVNVVNAQAAVDPAMELARHFCRPELLRRDGQGPNGALSRAESFELHAHKRYHLFGGELPVNSWMRCKSGIMHLGPDSRPVVVAEQDINTLPEETAFRKFGEGDRQLLEVLGTMLREAREIMNLYFGRAG